MPLPRLGPLVQGRQRTQECLGEPNHRQAGKGDGRTRGVGTLGLGLDLASYSLLNTAQDPQADNLGTETCDGSRQWGALSMEGQ